MNKSEKILKKVFIIIKIYSILLFCFYYDKNYKIRKLFFEMIVFSMDSDWIFSKWIYEIYL